MKKDTCMRCGADKKQARQFRIGCSAWGENYPRHVWGVFRGKTITIKVTP